LIANLLPPCKKETFLNTRVIIIVIMSPNAEGNKKKSSVSLVLVIIVIAAVVVLFVVDRTPVAELDVAELDVAAPDVAAPDVAAPDVAERDAIEGILQEIRSDAFVVDKDGESITVPFQAKDFTVVQKIPGEGFVNIEFDDLLVRSQVQIVREFNGEEPVIQVVIMEGVEYIPDA